MTELTFLNLFLSVAFVLGPQMTNRFFLGNSKIYSAAHKVALVIIVAGWALNLNYLTAVWPIFCLFGFILFLKGRRSLLLTARGIAACLPFLFSLISATWFFAGSNDLQLLGYNKVWSFYAAIHGAFLGWIFVGCTCFLAMRPNSNRFYLWSCYLSFVFFLSVAFGIDGIPHLKKIGVIGLSLLVPASIGMHVFEKPRWTDSVGLLSLISLGSISISMTLALANEFWLNAPRTVFGAPLMVLTHGFLNAIVAVPCFFLAICRESKDDRLTD